MEDKGQFWHYQWYQLTFHLSEFYGNIWQYKLCIKYIWKFDMWFKLKNISIGKIIINYNTLFFIWWRNLCYVWNKVLWSQICQHQSQTEGMGKNIFDMCAFVSYELILKVMEKWIR